MVVCSRKKVAVWACKNRRKQRSYSGMTEGAKTRSACYLLPEALPLPLPFPKDLPSKPGRPLSFFVLTPFRLSFRLSLRAAMLSVRFFCFAAMDVATCSLRSSLCTVHQHAFSMKQTRQRTKPSCSSSSPSLRASPPSSGASRRRAPSRPPCAPPPSATSRAPRSPCAFPPAWTRASPSARPAVQGPASGWTTS